MPVGTRTARPRADVVIGPYGGPTGAPSCGPSRMPVPTVVRREPGCLSGGAKPQERSVVGFRGGNSQHPSVDLCILSLDRESMAGVWGGSAHPGTNQYHKDGIRRESVPTDGQWPSLHPSDGSIVYADRQGCRSLRCSDAGAAHTYTFPRFL